jgi:hypothetical protein
MQQCEMKLENYQFMDSSSYPLSLSLSLLFPLLRNHVCGLDVLHNVDITVICLDFLFLPRHPICLPHLREREDTGAKIVTK